MRGQAARVAQEVAPKRPRSSLDEVQDELGMDVSTLAGLAVLAQGMEPGDDRLLRLLPCRGYN